jgi:hypothetical protein
MMQPPADHPRFSPVGEADDEGFLHPPWVKYPNIHRRSIGWRMGFGEDYWVGFRRWWCAQPQAVRERVRAKYPDVGEWAGFWQMASEWAEQDAEPPAVPDPAGT